MFAQNGPRFLEGEMAGLTGPPEAVSASPLPQSGLSEHSRADKGEAHNPQPCFADPSGPGFYLVSNLNSLFIIELEQIEGKKHFLRYQEAET